MGRGYGVRPQQAGSPQNGSGTPAESEEAAGRSADHRALTGGHNCSRFQQWRRQTPTGLREQRAKQIFQLATTNEGCRLVGPGGWPGGFCLPGLKGERGQKGPQKLKRPTGFPVSLKGLQKVSLSLANCFTLCASRLTYFMPTAAFLLRTFLGSTTPMGVRVCGFTLVSSTAVDHFAAAAAFFLVARFLSSRRVRESAALNGYRRTDSWPVVLRTTSTRRF